MAEQKNNQDKNKSNSGTVRDQKPVPLRESVVDYSEKNSQVVTSTVPPPKPKTDDNNE